MGGAPGGLQAEDQPDERGQDHRVPDANLPPPISVASTAMPVSTEHNVVSSCTVR